MVVRILESTFVLILAYLVIANAGNFSKTISALGSVYIGAVKTLQGR
jgi:hypothetical protein